MYNLFFQFLLKSTFITQLLLVAIGLIFCLQSIADEAKPRLLVIGGLHAQVDKLDGVIEPMASYIEGKLAEIGPIEVVVVFAQDREHLARLVRHGRVDWISQTAYNGTYFLSEANMEVLARGWRGGQPTYKSVFFVRDDSEVKTLDGLRNRTIAFEHPYSTSAFFIPKAELESQIGGVELLADEQASPALNHAGYRFSRSEYNSALWVHKGIVDAGVFSGIKWENESIVPQSLKKDLRIIHETDDIVRALELVRHDLDQDIKAKLQSILQNIHADSEAKAVREAYYQTERFDMLSEADFESIERLNEAARMNFSTRFIKNAEHNRAPAVAVN